MSLGSLGSATTFSAALLIYLAFNSQREKRIPTLIASFGSFVLITISFRVFNEILGWLESVFLVILLMIVYLTLLPLGHVVINTIFNRIDQRGR